MLKGFRILSISLISIGLVLISCAPSKEELYDIGFQYAIGLGDVERDQAKAVDYFSQAANQDHVPAQLTLGSRYQQGLGVEQDYEKARYWYERVITSGYFMTGTIYEAEYKLGSLYQEGLGNYEEARYWYERAANHGNEPAIYKLGSMYQEGLLGVEQDYEKARYWYEQIDNEYNPLAQRALETLPEKNTSNNSVTQPVQTSSATSTTTTLQGNIGQANDVASAIDSTACGNGDFDNLRTILPIYNNIPVLKEALDSVFLGDFQTMYAQGKAQGRKTSDNLKELSDNKKQFVQNRESSIQALNQWLTVDPVAWIAAIDAGTAGVDVFGDESQGPLGQDANWSRSYLLAQYSLARVNMIIACYEEVE